MAIQLSNITFDAHDPQRLAAFWAAVTGRATARSEPNFVMLTSEQDPVRMLFIKVPEGKTAKNRMHLDFRAPDRAAEVARLVGLGATEHARHDERGVSWTVLTDPEGNEFCVSQR
jgi:catechol-2,3-dioxygenase